MCEYELVSECLWMLKNLAALNRRPMAFTWIPRQMGIWQIQLLFNVADASDCMTPIPRTCCSDRKTKSENVNQNVLCYYALYSFSLMQNKFQVKYDCNAWCIYHHSPSKRWMIKQSRNLSISSLQKCRRYFTDHSWSCCLSLSRRWDNVPDFGNHIFLLLCAGSNRTTCLYVLLCPGLKNENPHERLSNGAEAKGEPPSLYLVWFLVIVPNLKVFHILKFYSADSQAIVLLVKPPTHGWSSLKGFKGESVEFKWITT